VTLSLICELPKIINVAFRRGAAEAPFTHYKDTVFFVNCANATRMEPIFDRDKLDVYALELQFVTWTTDFLEEVTQSPVSGRRELVDQLDRASISVLLNTAEGNAKTPGPL
jgi:hypothetical protein